MAAERALLVAFEQSTKHRHETDIYTSRHQHISGLIDSLLR